MFFFVGDTSLLSFSMTINIPSSSCITCHLFSCLADLANSRCLEYQLHRRCFSFSYRCLFLTYLVALHGTIFSFCTINLLSILYIMHNLTSLFLSCRLGQFNVLVAIHGDSAKRAYKLNILAKKLSPTCIYLID